MRCAVEPSVKMSLKYNLFIIFHIFHFYSISWTLPAQTISDPLLGSPIEELRQVYLMHPCTNKEMVQRIFNDFVAIRGPKQIGQLESEEAEMDLLYIMIIGKGLTLSPNKWYLMFEKIVDEYDSAVPFSEERKVFNEKMIQRYLTPEQTKRLNIFSQTIASDFNQNDVKVLLRYLYGFSIGYALEQSESDIAHLLMETSSMQELTEKLEKLANEQCQKKMSIHINPDSHIVYDLIKTLLTDQNSMT